MNLGPYNIQFPEMGYQVAESSLLNVIPVRVTDIESDAIVSLERIQRDVGRDGLLRYVKIIYSERLLPLNTQGAALISCNQELTVNSRPGFEICFSYPNTSVYVIGFWIEGDDAILIFSATSGINFTSSRDKVRLLARSIQINNLDSE